MANREDTPFTIEFKERKQNNYGTAMRSSEVNRPRGSSSTAPGISGTYNNNSSSGGGGAGSHESPSILYCLHGKSHIEVRDHCHRQRSEGVDVTARKKLIIASVLCLFFMICEIIGGILSNSLAIATDAAHLLTDFASFMISLFAIWIAGRPSTQRMSFGWYRAEVIGAMASVVMIWFITAILVWLAIQRLINRDFEVDAKIMLITSGLAILVNLIMGCQLQHGHTHGGGHSHGSTQKKNKKKQPAAQPNIQQPTADKLSGTLALDTARTCDLDGFCTPNTPTTPDTPASRPLGNGDVEVTSSNGQIPALGLETYSYQNSQPSTELHADMAAVMAETAPGAHHHGGAAAKDAENMNVRAAYIHVLGDMVQSVGVFLAALLIFFRPDWAIVDPICTFIFSVIVLFTTFNIMKDALLVLMEGTPNYMHYAEVLDVFQRIEGVQRVHNLRIWALSINKIALSVHLAISPGANPKKILQDATTAVHLRYNFFETTIQIEDFTPNMENCQQCTVPQT